VDIVEEKREKWYTWFCIRERRIFTKIKHQRMQRLSPGFFSHPLISMSIERKERESNSWGRNIRTKKNEKIRSIKLR